MKVLRHMFVHFHSYMIHNSQKVETTPMSINGRMDNTLRHIRKMDYYLARKINGVLLKSKE